MFIIPTTAFTLNASPKTPVPFPPLWPGTVFIKIGEWWYYYPICIDSEKGVHFKIYRTRDFLIWEHLGDEHDSLPNRRIYRERWDELCILIGFDAYVGMDHNYYVMGTRGTLETDKTAPLETASSYAKFADVPGTYYNKLEIPLHLSFPGESTAGHGGADHKMLMDFVRCIQEDTPPPLDVDDGIRMSLPGIIAHESSLRGGELMMIPEV